MIPFKRSRNKTHSNRLIVSQIHSEYNTLTLKLITMTDKEKENELFLKAKKKELYKALKLTSKTTADSFFRNNLYAKIPTDFDHYSTLLKKGQEIFRNRYLNIAIELNIKRPILYVYMDDHLGSDRIGTCYDLRDILDSEVFDTIFNGRYLTKT